MPELYHWHALEKFINAHNYRIGVEVGVRWGQTSRYLLENIPDLMMFGVDLMRPMPEHTDEGQETYTHWPWQRYRGDVSAIMQRWPKRFRMMVMDTTEASTLFDDESVDFVFIDCDHSYDGVRGDIENWGPKVKIGGMITGHDINLDSVQRAIADTIGQHETKGEQWNNIWWVRKTISDLPFVTESSPTSES